MASPIIKDNVTVDFKAMTMAQLKDEALRLAAVLDLATSQRREIHRLMERRKADAAATQRIASLSAVEKDALRAVLT